MRIVLLLGVVLLAQGCAVHVIPPRRPVPAPAPPPPSRPVAMSYDEAVSYGLRHCQSRGYECHLKEAHRTGNDVWKVKFKAFAPGAKGHVHLDYHAYTRELLKVNEKVKGGGHDHDHDDDDDGGWDDDDGRGHGRGKKKGHAKRDD